MKKPILVVAGLIMSCLLHLPLVHAQNFTFDQPDLLALNSPATRSLPEFDRISQSFHQRISEHIESTRDQVSDITELSAGQFILAGLLCYNRNREAFDNGSTVEDIRTLFQIQAFLGYFLYQNFALGLGLGYDWDKFTRFDDTYALSSVFYLAPMARYYYFLASRVALVAQLKIPFEFVGGEDRFLNTVSGDFDVVERDAYLRFGFYVSPIISWYMTQALALELGFGQIGFNVANRDFGGGTEITSALAFKLSYLNPTLGLTLLLGQDRGE